MNASDPSPRYTLWNASFIHLQIGFWTAIILYTVYIFLIFTKMSKQMLAYRKVLLLNTVLDLTFVFVNLFLHSDSACLNTDKGIKCFRFGTGYWMYPPREIVYSGLILSNISIGWYVPGVALIFLYRYFLICRNNQMNAFFFICCAVVTLLVPAMISLSFDGYRNWPKTEDLLYEKYFLGPEWKYNGRGPTYTVPSWAQSPLELIAPIIPSYIGIGVIIFCTISINATLKRLKNNKSPKHRRMQHEMSIILWLQAILPFISFIIPLTVYAIGASLGADTSFVYIFTKLSIWAGAINVILSIFIITPFRTFFTDKISIIERTTHIINHGKISVVAPII